jgi:hypothetical protein
MFWFSTASQFLAGLQLYIAPACCHVAPLAFINAFDLAFVGSV